MPILHVCNFLLLRYEWKTRCECKLFQHLGHSLAVFVELKFLRGPSLGQYKFMLQFQCKCMGL